MNNYVSGIYDAFYGSSESSYLVIKGEDDNYTFSTSKRYDEQVALRTWEAFRAIFEDYDVLGVCQQEKITRLDKRSVRNILVKMAVFQEAGPRLELEDIETVEKLFLDKTPTAEKFRHDKAKNCGKGFHGLCDKVYLQWLHYFSVKSETDDTKTKIREAEFLTGRLGDREFQEGAYVYLGEERTYQVDHVVVKRGAYISILKNITHPKEVKIVCRGTRISPKASGGLQSGLDDLHYEFGNGGVQACWPSISGYLANNDVEEVEVLGKSLGGAHAQRLAILIMKHHDEMLKEVTTVYSVGVGKEAETIFKSLVDKADTFNDLKLTVIRNGGDEDENGVDYIPCLGGEHLGATIEDENKLKLKIHYSYPSKNNPTQIDPKVNFFKKEYRFARSFPGPHIRQTSLEDFSYITIDDRSEIAKQLKYGKSLERVRRWIAFKAPISFTDFVENPSLTGYYTVIQKIVVTVGGLLFALTLAGALTCFFLHLGMVIYQGGGIVLTLPTAILGSGSGLSLLSVAIGSIHWAIAAHIKKPQSI